MIRILNASNLLLLFSVFYVLSGVLIASSEATPPTSLMTVTDPTTQLTFTFPSTFHLTRYQDSPMMQPAQRTALPAVLVLAEHRLHQSTPQTSIVIGSLPTISIDLLTGDRAAFNQVFLRPEFRKTIGQRVVYELPAHQGPIHQQIYYYLVPLSADRIVEIAGHRFDFTNTQAPPTHYDQVIAGIITSLTSGLM